MEQRGRPDPMSSAEGRRLRLLALEAFAREGRAPTLAELARTTAATPGQVRELLGDLADAHLLVLDGAGDSIRMAHPFAATPMGFVVAPLDEGDERRWWGGCAWDSFGISAALDLDVRVDTTCPHCAAPLSVATGPGTPPPEQLVVRFPRPAPEWWDDVVATCSSIRMFCSRDHADRWTAAHAPGRGQVVPAVTVWDLALAWYADRLAPDFRRPTREHQQALLDERGLDGDFWRLPPAARPEGDG